MRDLGIDGSRGRRRVLQNIGLLAAVTAFGAASAVAGCGGESTTGTTSTSATSTSAVTSSGTGGGGRGTGGASVTTATATASSSASGSGGSGGSGGSAICDLTATGSLHGSAIAVSPDDTRVVTVNRDAGTVTVMAVSYADGQPRVVRRPHGPRERRRHQE